MIQISTINLLYAVSFLDLLAVGLIFPLFANHLRELGASHTLIGVCNSIYSGLQLFSGPLIGAWSDIRDRKSVLQVTLFLCATAYSLLGLTNSIYFIVLLRIILGFVKHTQSICRAVITDIVPPNERSKVFGRSAALSSLGFIIGPFIGGNLSEVKHGFTYVALITGVSFLINLGICRLLPDVPKHGKPQNNVSVISTIKNEFSKAIGELRDLDWKVHWDSFLLRFLFGLSVTCYFSNQSLYLKEKYELSQKHIGYTISFFSTIGMVSAFFLDQIERFYKDDRTYFRKLLHFSLILTTCFIGIGISPNLVILLLLLVPFAIASTVIRVASMELMLEKSDETHKGSLSGASNSVMSFARFITPFVTGIFSDIFTEESVMFVGAVPAFLCVLLIVYLKKRVPLDGNKNK